MSEYLLPADPAPRPQLAPIKALHRHDGYISFATRCGEDDWKQVIAIKATALDEWFPQFTEQLVRDSFVSINASYCLASGSTKKDEGFPKHRNDTLRYLCACYCDLDYYTRGLKSHEVTGEVARLKNEGTIPQPSMLVDSGRGMWLLWMLHDPDNPYQAHCGAWNDNPNDNLQLYTKINQELSHRLTNLGADPIHDGARYIRVPGSFRNGTETYVEWSAHGNSDRPYSYTLKELAALVGVELGERPKQERRALSQRSQPCGNRSMGWKKANDNRLAAIVTIFDLRAGGLAEGCRNKAALYFALALRAVNVTRQEASDRVLSMGKACKPSLRPSACLGAVNEAYKPRKGKKPPRYQTLADDLDVTADEAEIVSQNLGKPFPAAKRCASAPVTKISGESTREYLGSERRRLIHEIIGDLGSVPSLRRMASLLFLRYGFDTSYVTVKADYAAMDIVGRAKQPITEFPLFPCFNSPEAGYRPSLLLALKT